MTNILSEIFVIHRPHENRYVQRPRTRLSEQYNINVSIYVFTNTHER